MEKNQRMPKYKIKKNYREEISKKRDNGPKMHHIEDKTPQKKIVEVCMPKYKIKKLLFYREEISKKKIMAQKCSEQNSIEENSTGENCADGRE